MLLHLRSLVAAGLLGLGCGIVLAAGGGLAASPDDPVRLGLSEEERRVLDHTDPVLLSAPRGTDAPRLRKHQMHIGGLRRTCHVFVPAGVAATNRAPLLLLLHGSGQGGRALAQLWQPLASRERVILAAPDARDLQSWNARFDGPDFLREVIDAVAGEYPVERRQLYLFGYSGGAHFGLQMALAESEYFAAAAFYAGMLRPAQTSLTALARRRIPLALFGGTEDEVVPIDSVRRTRRLLKEQGFPIDGTELRGWGHAYRNAAYQSLHRQVWEFLQRNRLTQDPIFVPYSTHKEERRP